MNTDERRALEIVKQKFPDNPNLESEFKAFLKTVEKWKKPQEIADLFVISKSSIHAHPAYFGSELACPDCNPVCYQNHGMNKTQWCGEERCPMNPERFRNVSNK